MAKRGVIRELHIGKQIVPQGTEVSPGDFGLTEAQLDEMEKAGQLAAIQSRTKRKKGESEETDEK